MTRTLIWRNGARAGSAMGVVRARPYYGPGSLSAAYYDIVTDADARLAGDVDAYATLATPPAEVLELGAGSGRILIALAERGFSVTGVDIQPHMLARAQARLPDLPRDVAGRIRLVQGDMTSLALRQTFDLVICTYYTLSLVPAGAAWRNTFAAVARHLAPGALAAFHLPRAQTMQGMPPPNPERPVMLRALPDGGRLALFVHERSYRERLGRFDQVIEYSVSDAGGRPLRSSLERLTFYMADPQPYAAQAGLVVDRPPIEVHGIGDIWVFRKA
jgi:SAM-dependent methyltransferase